MGELVNRRTAQTRSEIVDAALQLFQAQGFDNTSMEQVADAAGVSRRTIYRYFFTKDDLVFESPRLWLRVLNETLETREPQESTRDLFRRALLEVARFIEADREVVLAGFSILAGSPSLMARHGRSDAEWTARYLELLGPDVANEPNGPLIATTAAMAIVAAQNALIAVWATSPPGADLIAMAEVVIEQIDSLWPSAARSPPR
jgi:AcrR family transcriptional regulator